jgi:hypothetical protein
MIRKVRFWIPAPFTPATQKQVLINCAFPCAAILLDLGIESGTRQPFFVHRSPDIAPISKRGLQVFIPAVPEIGVHLAIGDDPEGIPHLFFIKLAERAGLVHATIHFEGLGRTGGSAEVPDGTMPAGLDLFDFALGNQPEGLGLEDIGNIRTENDRGR